MRYYSVIFALLLSLAAMGQESQTAYNFLRVPVSAHASALGGENITLVEDDPSLVFNNPALLSSVSDKMLGLNFMTYMQGAIMGGASFSRAQTERLSWGVMAQYVNYGSMKETNADNVESGTFSANDIALEGTVCYELARNLYGGLTAKWIGSFIGSYSSMAMGVDLGLNYYNPVSDWSLAIVGKNLGGQLKAYEENYAKMPMELQLGVTKGFGRIPLRLHITFADVTHWHYSFINHLVFGAEFIIAKKFYVAGGYNCRRAYDMKVQASDGTSGSHGAGLSVGAGVLLDRLKINFAWSKYHVSSSALVFNLAYRL